MFPIHLSLFGNNIYFYEGIYFALAFLAAMGLFYKHLKTKPEFDIDAIFNLFIVIMVGSIVVGRLTSLMFWNAGYFFSNPLSLFQFWEGGISVTGGLIGGLIGAWIFSSRKKIDFFKVFKEASPFVLLGQAVGRIGCFMNGDAHGIPTNLPWGLQFPKFGTMIPGFETNTDHVGFAWNYCFERGLVDADSLVSLPMHPTQIYEILANGIIFGIYMLMRKKDAKASLYPWMHFGLYFFFRFLLEFVRGDRTDILPIGVSNGQIFMVITSVVCLGLFIFFLGRPEPALQAETEATKKNKKRRRK